MAHLDSATRQRLEQLRARDVIGVYASDEPSQGSDPSHAVTATVDPTLRIVRVDVHDVEKVRTGAELSEALDSAYRAAVTSRLRTDQGAPAPRGEDRPVARRVRRVSAAPTPERLNRHQTRYRERGHAMRPRLREVRGTSRNDCVSVSIAPASPRGLLDVDPGWLAVTSGARLGAAITEAFADAYARRDQS